MTAASATLMARAQPQGGEQQRLEIQSLLPGGWRFVTDYNHLSSLTFRLAFADSFGEAVNSESAQRHLSFEQFPGIQPEFRGPQRQEFSHAAYDHDFSHWRCHHRSGH